jgi:DNA-binding NarL/FixJ family response regulator
MIRILIYEDNDDFRGAVAQLIHNTEGYECIGGFRDCTDVVNQLRVLRPDLILMDIEMQESNGIDGVRKIRQDDAGIPVIMLTVFDDNTRVLDAICAGASGYLLKKDTFKKLFDSIEEVLGGGAPLSVNIARLVIRHLASQNSRPSKDTALTSREKDILNLLADGNNNKMAGNELGISPETVKTHIKNIYTKLQVHTQAEAVAKALRDKLI